MSVFYHIDRVLSCYCLAWASFRSERLRGTEFEVTLKNLFKAASLKDICTVTKNDDLDDAGFGQFQRDHLCKTFTKFSYDKCILRFFEIDDEGELQICKSIYLGFGVDSGDINANYAPWMNSDELLRLTLNNPGRLLSDTDVYEGVHSEREIYVQYGSKYGIHHQYMVCFSFPENDESFLSIEYIGDVDNLVWDTISPEDLEYASFLFAMAWMVRYKRIGRRNFEKNISALSDMTLKKLQKLRRYINRKPGEQLIRQAESLGLKLRGYDDALYTMRDALNDHLVEASKAEKMFANQNLELLDSCLYLLKIMNDQTRPIACPAGTRLTPSFYVRKENQHLRGPV